MVHQISSDDFEELIKDKKVSLLDVREKSEFNAGHIKGARLVPSTRFDEAFDKIKIKKKDKIAIYCYSGNRSDFIGKKLVNQGYDNVYNLEMGTIEWLDYGKKLVK
ncbi:MAG: rhodanese-like domain-containing protein [Patescibacteria group bacterium]|jgi:rhodanese-related sulfurtransferase|nr:rhodanese-like domain-containing protein [Patescibacteria group bacterium]